MGECAGETGKTVADGIEKSGTLGVPLFGYLM